MIATVVLLIGMPWVSAHSTPPVDPERLPALWRLEASPLPATLDLPPRAVGCAVVAFSIDTAGVPRNARVVHSDPDKRFGAAARQIVELRHYLPGPENPRAEPEQTFEILTFGVREARTGSRLRSSMASAAFEPCDLDAREVALRLGSEDAPR